MTIVGALAVLGFVWFLINCITLKAIVHNPDGEEYFRVFLMTLIGIIILGFGLEWLK